MAKYNEIAKQKREAKANRKRAIHGDPLTNKLKTRVPVPSVSGKRQRKLLRKWRREQKDMVDKGLVTMEDVEMASAEAASEDSKKSPKKISVKKTLKLNKLKNKAKNNEIAKQKRKAKAEDAFAFLKTDNDGDHITFMGFCEDEDVISVHNGMKMMQMIIATGCSLAGLIAAFLAIDLRALEATVSAMSVFGIAGELGEAMANVVSLFYLC